MTPGHCTACACPAEQAPSGTWFHLGPVCAARNYAVWPVGGSDPRATFTPT